MSFINPNNNINLWIKHSFISFAQGYFSQVDKYTWNSNPITTKIIIADKFSVDLGVIDKKPAIIFSRGMYSWSDTIRSQNGENSVLSKNKVNKLLPAPTASRFSEYIFTDLLQGSITYNIISKNGIEAEEIADILFSALSAYKNELKTYGINKTMGLSVSDERIVKTDSEIRAIGVSVSLGFVAQKSLKKALKLYNVEILVNCANQTYEYKENIDFIVTENGTRIEFLTSFPECAISITINYIDAITLETRSYTYAIADIINLSNPIYGYYKMLAHLIISGVIENQEIHIDE